MRAYLAANYTGPIALHPESDVETMAPPYAVLRVGTGEQLYPGQVEIWDINLLIGVFHDADTTTPATAETQSAALFAMLDNPVPLFAASSPTLAWSALERHSTEASIIETRWQHVAGFRAIVAPA